MEQDRNLKHDTPQDDKKPARVSSQIGNKLADVGNIDVKNVTEPLKRRKVAGGAAAGGGIKYQAAVSAIAYVYMVRCKQLSWLEKVAEDIPVAWIRFDFGPRKHCPTLPV